MDLGTAMTYLAEERLWSWTETSSLMQLVPQPDDTRYFVIDGRPEF